MEEEHLRHAVMTFHHNIWRKRRTLVDRAILSNPASTTNGSPLGVNYCYQRQSGDKCAVHQSRHVAVSATLRTVNTAWQKLDLTSHKELNIP